MLIILQEKFVSDDGSRLLSNQILPAKFDFTVDNKHDLAVSIQIPWS